MMIKHCFGNRCIEMEVTQLLSSRSLPNNVKFSKKYKQIVFSIQEIGLVEPIVICILNSGKILKILDGHLRVEAFKELGITHIPCLRLMKNPTLIISMSIDFQYFKNKKC